MVWLLVSAAHAATLQVGPSRAYTTIQAAVDAAADGDTIEVDAGTYAEDVVLGGVSVALVGAGSGSTVLAATGTALDATQGEALSVEGLTVRGGQRGLDATGDLVLSDVIFSGTGDAGTDGAAVRLVGGTLSWSGGSADYTTARFGAVYLEQATATLDGVDLQYGTAEVGGGLFAMASHVVLTGSSLVQDEATENGGCIYISEGSLQLESTALVSCTAGGDGGGLYAADAEVSLTAGAVEQCSAASWGGAVLLTGGDLAVSESEFSHNAAAMAGDIHASGFDSLVIEGSSFSGSTASSMASLRVEEGAVVRIAESSFEDGFASEYGCYVGADTVELNSLTVSGYGAIPDALRVLDWSRSVAVTGSWALDANFHLRGAAIAVEGVTMAGDGHSAEITVDGPTTIRASAFDGVLVTVFASDSLEMSDTVVSDGDYMDVQGLAVLSDVVLEGTRLNVLGSVTGKRVVVPDPPEDSFGVVVYSSGPAADFTRLRVTGATASGIKVASGSVTLHQAYVGDNSAADSGGGGSWSPAARSR